MLISLFALSATAPAIDAFAAKGGNGDGNPDGNNADNASDRAKEIANHRSAVAKVAVTEERTRLGAELAELERQLVREGLRVQTDGSLVN